MKLMLELKSNRKTSFMEEEISKVKNVGFSSAVLTETKTLNQLLTE